MDERLKTYERFYFKEMPDDEYRAFKEELNSDNTRKKEYRHFVAIMESLELDISKKLKSQMQSWEKKSKPLSSRGKIIPIFRRMAIAASVLLVVGFFTANILYSDSAILSDKHSDIILSPTRGDNSAPETYYKIYNSYEIKDYQNAIDELENIEKDHRYYGQALVIAAKSYQQLGETDSAHETYLDAIDYFHEHNLQVAEESTQYDYLLFLFNTEGETEEFKQILQEIIDDPNHLYQHKATELHNQLSSFWRKMVVF